MPLSKGKNGDISKSKKEAKSLAAKINFLFVEADVQTQIVH
jgi:hypothetical protein